MDLPELTLTDKAALKIHLEARCDFNYDHQAGYLIGQASYLFRVRIADLEIFQNMIPNTWVLSDPESPRTLDVIANRILDKFGSLDRLVEAAPCHDRSWYERIKYIYDNFSWEKYGPVFLCPVEGDRTKSKNKEGSELDKSPTASFSVLNGLHSSLAAMLRIRQGIAFKPFEAVLLLPRINY